MSNLIITIISIALVAVAAIMGAWYGGSAFMEGQLKAKANKILNDMSQIKAAYLLYRVEGGNLPTGPVSLDGSDILRTNGYLSGSLIPGADISTTNLYYLRNIIPLVSGETDYAHTRTTVILSDISTCYMLNRIIRNNPEPARWQYGDTTWSVYTDSNGLGKLQRLQKWGADCYYQDDNDNNTRDSGETIVFHMMIQ